MKTIKFSRDYDYAATKHYLISYKAGTTVERVPETAVVAILAAGAGEVVEGGDVAEDEPVSEPVNESPKPRKRGAKP